MATHVRTWIVDKASKELDEFLHALVVRHDLTSGEVVTILASRLTALGRQMRQHERHPEDPSKGADEA